MQSDKNVMYENTRLDTKGIGIKQVRTEVIKDKTNQSNNAVNRIKCLLITMLVMMIVLYVAVFVFIIIFAINIPVKQALLFSEQPDIVRIIINGDWAAWSEWSSCDVTCGNGSKSRSRTCTNPTPTTNGIFCAGSVTEISVCQLSNCLDQRSERVRNYVSFSARLANGTQTVKQHKRVVFNEITTNNMNGYDNRSGIFKAPESGVYLFMYFIQITDAYGEVELRVSNESVSATTLYGITTELEIYGSTNYFAFKNTNLNQIENTIMDNIICFRGAYGASGSYNTAEFQMDISKCPFKSGIKTAGGDSVVIFVHAGSEVWVQNSGSLPIHIQPDGTTFTGFLLVKN